MEFIFQFLLYAIGAYVAYIVADRVKTRNPGIDIEPTLYAIGSVIFGYMWVIIFLFIKLAWYNSKNK